jgi:hypothetical protein
LAAVDGQSLTAQTAGGDFSAQYTALTRQILLDSIALERFSLTYRLQNGRISTLQKLIFFGTQQAGSSCGLAFEIIADEQFNRARRHPLQLDKGSLKRGLRTAEVGSIVAASGSGFELAVNLARSVKNKRHGLDPRSANTLVISKLQHIDGLLRQRDALIAANSQHPAHDRAVIEGNILRLMRSAFVNEFATFSADTRSATSVQNLFYLLNATYNTIGALGAGYGYSAVNKPKLNGTANILFIVSGAMVGVTPLICSTELWAERKLILNSLHKKLGGGEFDPAEMAKQRALLEAAGGEQGSLMPSLPSTQRMAIYTESNQLFEKQIQNETTTMRKLNKVAVQNLALGPVIGGLLMTQGILGTHGYYSYFPRRIRTQLDLDYKGAVVGTVGTGLAVVGNAAWLLASLSYEHHLRKNHKLPEQLIKDRLEHLDELEKTVTLLK